MTREQKITALVELIEDWDIDTLLWWSKEQKKSILNELSDKEIEVEYHDAITIYE